MISFGALAAFSFVNLSVIKHYVVDGGRRTGRDLLLYGLVPLVGVLLTAWLWTSLSGTTFTVGGLWVLAGLIWLGVITRGFRQRPPELRMTDAEIDEDDELGEPVGV
jgi:amino acid transporter